MLILPIISAIFCTSSVEAGFCTTAIYSPFFTSSCALCERSSKFPVLLATSLMVGFCALILICPVTMSGYLIIHPNNRNNAANTMTANATHFPKAMGIRSIISSSSSLLPDGLVCAFFCGEGICFRLILTLN